MNTEYIQIIVVECVFKHGHKHVSNDRNLMFNYNERRRFKMVNKKTNHKLMCMGKWSMWWRLLCWPWRDRPWTTKPRNIFSFFLFVCNSYSKRLFHFFFCLLFMVQTKIYRQRKITKASDRNRHTQTHIIHIIYDNT